MSDSFVTPWTVAPQAPLLWDFPGKNTGVGGHFLLQGIFLTQGSDLGLLHWQVASFPLCHLGSTYLWEIQHQIKLGDLVGLVVKEGLSLVFSLTFGSWPRQEPDASNILLE